VNNRKAVADLSNRALLEEIATDLRHITGVLAELGPLLELGRAMSAGPPSYVRAAGMRRALRNGKVTDHA
jgi:hypothetical protein